MRRQVERVQLVLVLVKVGCVRLASKHVKLGVMDPGSVERQRRRRGVLGHALGQDGPFFRLEVEHVDVARCGGRRRDAAVQDHEVLVQTGRMFIPGGRFVRQPPPLPHERVQVELVKRPVRVVLPVILQRTPAKDVHGPVVHNGAVAGKARGYVASPDNVFPALRLELVQVDVGVVVLVAKDCRRSATKHDEARPVGMEHRRVKKTREVGTARAHDAPLPIHGARREFLLNLLAFVSQIRLGRDVAPRSPCFSTPMLLGFDRKDVPIVERAVVQVQRRVRARSGMQTPRHVRVGALGHHERDHVVTIFYCLVVPLEFERSLRAVRVQVVAIEHQLRIHLVVRG
ncbi:hypothetical protein H310_00861 [Aphanomyces invadans]|uniref:Uncharacterized protein n=1 Tax=Aphanomyces invadans TaxID=157072 RepID=A0A024UPI8_9STRA|nr:hypothetical protein H310_00861 [Aphanomyces invadans]ETW08214.1 hypothetical protein H310_00861 [Aphanomyces invadans]|eukprot:XP_008862019.1 hypothetical protein H310_00861 [Aphanomyces invadans]